MALIWSRVVHQVHDLSFLSHQVINDDSLLLAKRFLVDELSRVFESLQVDIGNIRTFKKVCSISHVSLFIERLLLLLDVSYLEINALAFIIGESVSLIVKVVESSVAVSEIRLMRYLFLSYCRAFLLLSLLLFSFLWLVSQAYIGVRSQSSIDP